VLTFSMDKMNMRVASSDGSSYLISRLNEYLSLMANVIIVGGTYIYRSCSTHVPPALQDTHQSKAEVTDLRYELMKAVRQQHYDSERCDRRRSRHKNAIDPYDMVMMYRFQAMEAEKVRAYLEGCEEMAAARELKGVEENVNSWRESLVPLTAKDTARLS
jgi:hypothetical protein